MTHNTKRQRKYAASYRADRMDALNQIQDQGGDDARSAAKAKRSMADTWQKRASGNPGALWRPNPKQGVDKGVQSRAAPKPLAGPRRVRHA